MPSARTESSWLVFRPRSDRMVGATWQGIVARPESGRRCLLRHARLGPRRSRQSPGQGTQVIEIVRTEARVRVGEADAAYAGKRPQSGDRSQETFDGASFRFSAPDSGSVATDKAPQSLLVQVI